MNLPSQCHLEDNWIIEKEEKEVCAVWTAQDGIKKKMCVTINTVIWLSDLKKKKKESGLGSTKPCLSHGSI